ncbi:hypothetical protein YC2023_004405 [Brassica napus]
MTSVGVRQHTQDIRGCQWLSVSTHMTFVAVRVCPSSHTGRPWLSISTHISTLVLGLSTLALPVDCLGDIGPCGLSVQYTQYVRGCPSAHTGRSWVFVSTNRTSVAVHVCLCVSVCVRQHTQDVRGCPSVHISARWSLNPYTQDVRGCPPAHTGHLWLSVSTHRTSVANRVCPTAHTGRPWLFVCIRVCPTYISTPVLGLSTLALLVDCSGDFGPRGLSVQYTQDVRGCPPAHTGHPWLSVSTHMTFVAIRVCPSAHTGRPWLSISTHISTLVLGLSTLALPVDCSGDIDPCGLSVQYTQYVHGCPSAHTGRPWVFVSTHRTSFAVHVCLCVSVCVRQHTQDVRGCPSVHISARWSLNPYTQDVRGCPPAHTGHLWLSVSTHRTSVANRVCPTAHTGRPWLFVCIRVCPTYISTPVLGLSTLALLVDCSGDFGPRGLSVQYTQDVRGCPPAHTGHPWLSVSTHMTFVAIRVCPSAHTGRPWLSISTHISTLVLGLSTLALPVDCSGDIDPCGLSVQYTQYVHGCPSAHTGRPWVFVSTHRTSFAVHVCLCVSVCVRQHTQDVRGCPSYTQDVRGCPPAYTGRPWLSVAIRQHTEDVRGCPCVSVCVRVCPSAHTGRPWTVWVILDHVGCLFSTHMTSVGVRQHTQDIRGCQWLSVSTHMTFVAVRVCPSAHTGRPWLSISTHISTLVLGLSTLALPVDCLGDIGPCGLSVQYTQYVRGCPSAHTGRSWVFVSTNRTSVAVHVCLCVSVCVRQHTQDVRGCPSVHISARCTHRTSVGVRQHTQDVCGCMWLSVSTHRTSVAVLVCMCVSVSTHRTSVTVYQYTNQHAGPWTQHAGASRGLFGLFWPIWAVWSVHTGRQ